MTKEQAEQLLKALVDNTKLTRQEYEILLKAISVLKEG